MTTENSTYVRYQFNQFGLGLEKTEVKIPKPTGTEILVRVNYCGVCHSDVHIYEGYYGLGQGKKLSLQDRGIKLPVTLGHEIVGTIEAVGNQVDASQIGKQMLVYPWIGCGECSVCERGEENLCTKPAALGVFKPGGYSEYVLIPHPRYLMDLGNLNPSHASLLACSGLTTFSAIKKIGPIHNDEAVVVIGCGGLGLLAIRTLSLLGVKNIIGLDLSEQKRELALKVGATSAFDPSNHNISESVLKASNANSTAILDFVGGDTTVELGLNLVRKGGKIIIIGLHGGELTYPIPYIITKAISIIGSYTGSLTDLKELIEFANKHDLFNLPIEVRPLNEANAALHQLADGHVEGRIVLQNS
ncbi:MAG: alcohol dehydrogenase catalytic domain-containing protein [Alcaligenaceae bacterium]|nr:alcohol dehydrogenase catalytic domain-containing protein [Alcaligenaceae bacterium]